MKLQLSSLLLLVLFICDLLVSAESEKTSEIVGRKKFNRPNKIRNKRDAGQIDWKRARFTQKRARTTENPRYKGLTKPGPGQVWNGK